MCKNRSSSSSGSGSSSSSSSSSRTRGARIYFAWVLRFIYDTLVLGLYLRYVWRCPVDNLTRLYEGQIEKLRGGGGQQEQEKAKAKARVLDVGVGTGYHLEHAALPPDCDIALADLNGNCLAAASGRISRAHPGAAVTTLVADFLSETDVDGDGALALSEARVGGRCDVISCMLLLHCLPGRPGDKAKAVGRLRGLLKPGGVVVGATVLGWSHVGHSWLGRFVMFWHNALGVFDNALDDVQGIMRPLEDEFAEVEWLIVGSVLLFSCRA